ncbi:MAG: tetratricopeptide repeat protein [Gemmatimonadota bacterium]|nr:tetratricopeptide repeat protein [Gemmatimonadota bacterium]
MVTWDRTPLRLVSLAVAGLLIAPLGAVAQEEECEFEGSAGAAEASEILRELSQESTEEEEMAAYAEAYAALEDELDDDIPVVLLLATQTQIGLGHYEEAEALLDRYEEIADPPCMEHAATQRYNGWVQLYNRGVEAYSAGNNDLALESFALANDFQPDLRSYGNAALLYAEIGETDRAIETYQAALAADLTDPDPEQLGDTIENLGSLLMEADRLEEAIAAYTEYLEEHPDDVGIQTKSAGALSEAGRTEEAAEISAEIMAREDLTASQWIAVGVALYNAQDFETASEAFANARQSNPYSKEAMENYVNASVQAGRPGPVLPLADTLVNWYPYDETNHQLYASALARADMNERAMQAMQTGEETDLIFHFVQMAPTSSGGYIVRGSFSPRNASGTVQIPFEFVGPSGEVVHTEVLTTEADAGTFRLEIEPGMDIAGFRYDKIGT